ncbi:fungal hydrophobin [Lentinus tigrinus ALCF2SS1-7]|uniref:Hydrophobin n=1 Tax=Lentinus tigrinus ALCF2SS1-6 TaxID=1328759 RepID=A0A5C2SNW8_9APHY|nr:fungal hydrophobin [Lentinus tigrinus ALCF2SS1-6]RPD79087.1 fungal hydrophobin [Lentinus tigrinus ALCF2SS1-7]
MFARVAAVASLIALPVLAAAADCSTGPIQCCQSLEKADSAAGSAILSLLGVVVQDVTAQIGLTCSPISVVGVGAGSACNANAVCCQNNNVGGLISIGCLPVEL